MNDIGMSCTLFSREPFGNVLDEVSRGFSHWEIFSEQDHMVQSIASVFPEAVAGRGMTFSIHSSIADTNLAALNPIMREASVEEIVSEIKAAVDMGIDMMTVHPGLISMSVGGTRDRSVAVAKESMRRLDKAAQQYGVTLCIENMPDFWAMLGIRASELAEMIDGTDLSVCFDIGHANTSGQIEAMVDTFGDRIRNVHIHDNHGKSDEHLTIGDGDVDFGHVLRLLKGYAGRFIIESRSLDSALESQRRLRGLLGERCDFDVFPTVPSDWGTNLESTPFYGRP